MFRLRWRSLRGGVGPGGGSDRSYRLKKCLNSESCGEPWVEFGTSFRGMFAVARGGTNKTDDRRQS